MTNTATWLADQGVFVAGKPLTDIWAPPGLRWRDTLKSFIQGPLRNPCLSFTRKDRCRYDLDNLVYPVIAASGCAACESVWATVQRGAGEGVLIRECFPPPPPDSCRSVAVYIQAPSQRTVAPSAVVPELVNHVPFGVDEPLGMALEFDSSTVRVGELSYEGPVKSLVDDLTPLFGEALIAGKLLAQDFRVRELRITRGHRPEGSGVNVRLWML